MSPRTIRRGAILSVATVALVAASVSYVHMYELATASGEGWLSWLEPLSVDGLLVGSSLVLMSGSARRWLAWLAVATGILASLAANLAAAGDGLVPHLVAGWPAVALALSYEALLTLVRPEASARRHAGEQEEPAGADRRPAPVASVATVDANPGGDPWCSDFESLAPVGLVEVPAPPDGPVHGPEPSQLDRARHLVRQAELAGDSIGRPRLAKELGVSEYEARKLLAEVNDEQPAA